MHAIVAKVFPVAGRGRDAWRCGDRIMPGRERQAVGRVRLWRELDARAGKLMPDRFFCGRVIHVILHIWILKFTLTSHFRVYNVAMGVNF